MKWPTSSRCAGPHRRRLSKNYSPLPFGRGVGGEGVDDTRKVRQTIFQPSALTLALSRRGEGTKKSSIILL